MTGIEAFLEILAGAGVRHLFGNPGTTELPLNDALARDPRFQYAFGLHEIPVVAMADGYAQASGNVGVANVHVSCGLGNAMGMLYNAHCAGTPVVLTAGQQDRRLRLGEPVLEVDCVGRKAALVAQPSVVDRVDVDAEQAGQPVGRRLHGHPAAHRARGAGRLDLVEVPRAGGEPVGGGGQGTHRADLHSVPREVGGEGQLGKRADLNLLAPTDEVDLGLACHLICEAGAPAALDTPLAVEQDQLGDGDGFLEMALLLDEPGFAGAIGQGLILQGAFAALVAHRAVERVVDQEELEDTVLGLLHLGRIGDDLHPGRRFNEAARHECGAARATHFHQTHPTHPDRLHARVVTEAWDEGAGPLGRGDEQLALAGAHGPTVECEFEFVHVPVHPGLLIGPRTRSSLITHRGSHLL